MTRVCVLGLLLLVLGCSSSPTDSSFDFEFLAGDWLGYKNNLVKCTFYFGTDTDYSYTEKYQAVALYTESGTVNGRVHAGTEEGGDVIWIAFLRTNSIVPEFIGTEWAMEAFVWEDKQHFLWNGVLFRKTKDR